MQLSPWKPLYTGVILSGILAAAAIPGVLFMAGSNPPMRVVLPAWGLVLGGGLLGYVLRRRRSGGRTELIIDELQGSVTLPCTCGRTEQVVIPVTKVAAIEVEGAGWRLEGSKPRDYLPTLLLDEGGAVRRENLVAWPDAASAEELVVFLRRQLRIGPADRGRA